MKFFFFLNDVSEIHVMTGKSSLKVSNTFQAGVSWLNPFSKAQVIWSRKINSDEGSGHWLSIPADQRPPTFLFSRAMLGNSTSCGKERAKEKQANISSLYHQMLAVTWYPIAIGIQCSQT